MVTRCSSSSLSLSVGFSIQDESVDVARSAPQGAHYHADVPLLFLLYIDGLRSVVPEMGFVKTVLVIKTLNSAMSLIAQK